MKFLRPLLLPIVCFAAAWAITFFVSKRTQDPPPELATTSRTATKAVRSHGGPRKISIPQLEHQFRTRPMSEWADLWENFATRATAADLEEIPQRSRTPRIRSSRRDASNVLVILAAEELALRAEKPLPVEPHAFGALAEADPQAALRNLDRYRRTDIATATLRTMAWHDPAAALERLRNMPSPMAMPGRYEDDVGEGGMSTRSPLEAIFAAWARRDPAAAAATVMKLPVSERSEAAAEVAMTWAYRDGPAATRFIMDFVKAADDNEIFRLPYILRASFRTHPKEMAIMMEENSILRKVMVSSWWCQGHVLKPWYEADPDGMVNWLIESGDAEPRRSLFSRFRYSPESTADLIRRLHAAGFASTEDSLVSLHYRSPKHALELANELNIRLPKDLPQSHNHDYDPEAACDRWLEALRRHGNPEAALAALGWKKETATSVASRASLVFPQKAAELARLVPASSLDGSQLGPVGTNGINRFWPELGRAPSDAPAKISFPFPESLLKRDPATTAEEMLSRPLSPTDVGRTVELWAPYDFNAARGWLSRIPEGEMREAGEMALFKIQATYDPVGVLKNLANQSLPFEPAGELWQKCLRRLVQTGGDWRGWLARMPAELARPHPNLGKDLAAEARLLELLRNPGGK